MVEKVEAFYDSEFTGLHQGTSLVSIGLITQDDTSFYAEFSDYNKSQVDPWIRDNVISNLKFKDKANCMNKSTNPATGRYSIEMKNKTSVITNALREWLLQFGEVEIWSDTLAYDMVLFNELFGGALKLPKGVYYIPFDIATMMKVKGIDPDISRLEYSGIDAVAHNSLDDAKMIRACYNKMNNGDSYQVKF